MFLKLGENGILFCLFTGLNSIPGKVFVLELFPNILMSNLIARFFLVDSLKKDNELFLHVLRYLWKQWINVVLVECSQLYSSIPKVKGQISNICGKSLVIILIFLHPAGHPLKLQIDHIILGRCGQVSLGMLKVLWNNNWPIF